MPVVVARQVFEYGGRMYAPGDKIDVEERFVRILVTVGRIEDPALARDGAGEPYRTANIATAPAKKADAPKRTRNRESLVGARRA